MAHLAKPLIWLMIRVLASVNMSLTAPAYQFKNYNSGFFSARFKAAANRALPDSGLQLRPQEIKQRLTKYH